MTVVYTSLKLHSHISSRHLLTNFPHSFHGAQSSPKHRHLIAGSWSLQLREEAEKDVLRTPANNMCMEGKSNKLQRVWGSKDYFGSWRQ